MIYRLLALTCILGWAVFAQAAEKPVKIYGYSLEFRLQEKGTKQYNRLFLEMAEQGLEFELAVQPFTRIIRDIVNHTACVFPVSINAIKTAGPHHKTLPLIASDPVDHISLRVFTRQDKPKITSLESLNGKKIAVWDGLNTDALLADIQAKIETTPNANVQLRMLDKGRLDAILGFTPDLNLAAESLTLPLPHFAESLALLRDEGASLVCHDNVTNQRLIQQFNALLEKMKHSGQLREILGPHAELAD